MKRLTLLTVLLVVVGLASGFALDVKPTIVISGTGTLQWGIDLDTMDTGFKNSATADMVVTLASGSDTHAGTGDWYGSIALNSFALSTTAGGWTNTIPTVVAKIVGLGGALSIGVYPAPDLMLDFVAAIEADADAADLVVDDESGFDVAVDFGTYGTYVSYTLSEALTVGLEVVSNTDWTVGPDSYAVALDILAKFAPLTLNAGVNYGFGAYGDVMGIGVKATVALAPLTAYVGFDASIDGSVFAYDLGAGLTMTVMETVTAALDMVFGDAFNDLDIKFVLTEPAAKGLVDNLDASLTVYLLDLLNTPPGLEYEVKFAAGYLAGKLYPHMYVTYGDPNEALVDAFLKVGVHVDYTLFDAAKTVLSLAWDSGDLLGTPAGMGTLVAGVTITY